jgi:hypothetical protein
MVWIAAGGLRKAAFTGPDLTSKTKPPAAVESIQLRSLTSSVVG